MFHVINDYEVNGNVTKLIICGSIPGQIEEFIFNTRHLLAVLKYKYTCLKLNGNIYAINKEGKYLHLIIFPRCYHVFIDGDTRNCLDNNVLCGDMSKALTFRSRDRKNKLGKAGVRRIVIKGRVYYRAALTIRGNTSSKWFSVDDYGEEEALRMAVNQRNIWEEEKGIYRVKGK